MNPYSYLRPLAKSHARNNMRQSHLFTKTSKENPKGEVSTNAILLQRAGFIDKVAAGVYTYLPLGLRVLNKIKSIVREEMNALGAQEILMPALIPKELWETTDRWDKIDVNFKLEGVGSKEYALGSTHEEVITPLLKKFVTSYKDLPVAVYQIQDKFRDEPRAKSGLLRGREFSMKDLYSFHLTDEDFQSFYEKSKKAYLNVYKRCGLDAMIVAADGGVFSKHSHEFQVATEAGEDHIYIDKKTGEAFNKEIVSKADQKNTKKFDTVKAIEVGNIFPLKCTFSSAFDFSVNGEDGKSSEVIMGCYGIGPSRILGSIVEVHHDKDGMLWPESVAPFAAHLLVLGDDSTVTKKAEKLYAKLQKKGIDVLFDDRNTSAGAKFADSDLLGIPHRLVISKKTGGKVEYKKRSSQKTELLTPEGATKRLSHDL